MGPWGKEKCRIRRHPRGRVQPVVPLTLGECSNAWCNNLLWKQGIVRFKFALGHGKSVWHDDFLGVECWKSWQLALPLSLTEAWPALVISGLAREIPPHFHSVVVVVVDSIEHFCTSLFNRLWVPGSVTAAATITTPAVAVATCSPPVVEKAYQWWWWWMACLYWSLDNDSNNNQLRMGVLYHLILSNSIQTRPAVPAACLPTTCAVLR